MNLAAWTLSTITMLAIVFGNHPFYQNNPNLMPLHYGLYDALSRVSWSIALCYVIFACVHNAGGPVNWFLSHPWWLPLSRLSYALCLVHYPILIVTMFTIKSSPHYNELTVAYDFPSFYILSIFVAIVATLAIEYPIINITKMIFSNSSSEDLKVRTELKKNT